MADKPKISYIEDRVTTHQVSSEPSDPFKLFAQEGPSNVPGNLLPPQELKLQLSVEDRKAMAGKIAAIFNIEEEPIDEDVEMDDDDDENAEPVIDLEDQLRRTESLKGVLSTLAQLWWADSEEMDLATEKLADGSRDRELNLGFVIYQLSHHASIHSNRRCYLLSCAMNSRPSLYMLTPRFQRDGEYRLETPECSISSLKYSVLIHYGQV